MNQFEKLYNQKKHDIILAAKKYSSELKLDLTDVISLFNEEFWKSFREYDAEIGKVSFNTFYSRRFKQRAYDMYRKKERKFFESAERIEGKKYNNGEEEAATFEFVDDFDLEEHVSTKLTGKQKDDQRQLIDFLVRGENERTTAIVQAFLNHPKPNATAIAKVVGLDHKQVSRALTRLASKFDSKQFGSHRDYLVAL